MRMSLRFASAVFLAACGLLSPAPAQVLGRSTAFIQQVRVPDFQYWEQQRELALSTAHDLVIYTVMDDARQTVSRVFAIKHRNGADSRFFYSASVLGGDQTGKPELRELDVSPAIARQIQAAFQRLLTTNVYPAPGGPYQGSNVDHAWIFLRTGPRQAVAGVALHDGLHRNDTAAARVFLQLTDGLHRLFEGPPEERNAILTEIDRTSAIFAQSGKL